MTRLNEQGGQLIKPVRLSPFRVGLVAIAVIGAVWATGVDLMGRVSIGPLTGSAVLSIVAFLAVAITAALGVIIVITHRRRSGESSGSVGELWSDPLFLATVGLVPFTVYAIISAAGTRTSEGFQSVIVWCLFAVTVPLVGWGAWQLVLDRGIRVLRVCAVVVSIVSVLSESAGVALYSGRSFAIVALIFLAATIFPQPRGLLARAAPYVVFIAIIASASRTATAVALAAIGLVALRDYAPRRRTAVKAAAVWLAGGAFFALVLSWGWIRDGIVAAVSDDRASTVGDDGSSAPTVSDRFLGTGDQAVSIGEIVVNTNGRIGAWSALLSSFDPQNWLFGNGAGAASRYLTPLFPTNFTQPHNEYLRILYDFGIFGAVLFGLGAVVLVVSLMRMALRTQSPLARGAVLAMFGVGLVAVTDNPFVYGFVMLPLGLFVGAAIADHRLRQLEALGQTSTLTHDSNLM